MLAQSPKSLGHSPTRSFPCLAVGERVLSIHRERLDLRRLMIVPSGPSLATQESTLPTS